MAQQEASLPRKVHLQAAHVLSMLTWVSSGVSSHLLPTWLIDINSQNWLQVKLWNSLLNINECIYSRFGTEYCKNKFRIDFKLQDPKSVPGEPFVRCILVFSPLHPSSVETTVQFCESLRITASAERCICNSSVSWNTVWTPVLYPRRWRQSVQVCSCQTPANCKS